MWRVVHLYTSGITLSSQCHISLDGQKSVGRAALQQWRVHMVSCEILWPTRLTFCLFFFKKHVYKHPNHFLFTYFEELQVLSVCPLVNYILLKYKSFMNTSKQAFISHYSLMSRHYQFHQNLMFVPAWLVSHFLV